MGEQSRGLESEPTRPAWQGPPARPDPSRPPDPPVRIHTCQMHTQHTLMSLPTRPVVVVVVAVVAVIFAEKGRSRMI